MFVVPSSPAANSPAASGAPVSTPQTHGGRAPTPIASREPTSRPYRSPPPAPVPAASNNPHDGLDLFGPGSPLGPMSDPVASNNPYWSAPLSTPVASPRRTHSDGKRPGFAWDRPGEDNAFGATCGAILKSLGGAFSEMKCSGGFTRPAYFVLCSDALVFGVAIGLLLFFVLVGNLMGHPVARPNAPPSVGNEETFFLVYGLMTLVVLALGVVVALAFRLLMTFLFAAFLHGCLVLLQGAHRGYETTFRVVAYAFGVANLFNLIPFCGGFATLAASFIFLTRGLARAHEIEWWRAFAAYLLILLMVIILVVGLVLVIPKPQ